VKKLLFVNEFGLYPELVRALQSTGYAVTVEHMMRKAIKFMQKQNPEIVVAEFVYDSHFRDRVSNLESLLAQIEGKNTNTRTILIYEPCWQEYLDQVREVFTVDAVLQLPLEADDLLVAVERFG
jgi:ActR/RegA family two-component response regulator